MEEVSARRGYLKAILNEPGGQILMAHLEEMSNQGFKEFIDLPVDKKTSKAAYDAQAKYKKLQEVIEWWELEASMAD